MGRVLSLNIFRFVIFILMQVFLFRNIGYYNLAAPFPYIYFLLALPLSISNFTLYTIAFLTGLTVDAFYDTPGVHAAACTALAWARVVFLNITVQPENHELQATPGISEMSFRWYFIYALVLSFFHHLVLFILEVFSFANFHYTLISVFLSCIFTVILLLLFDFIFYRKKKR